MRLKITVNGQKLIGELRDTETAQRLLELLPFQSGLTRWGDEIYFSAPIKASLEKDAKQVVNKRDICYWTSGGAVCIFFGPTPVSEGDECRAYEKVNVLGKIVKGDLGALKHTKTGDKVKVEKT
ncbi:hypothetical protein HYV81_04655 [Candidatus Woesearchaeota archaeon]|nr:hypothetical protein [Candidatus Woesearchaeota archaeon]